jgi:macrolide transport system ATP-binding/permease protein
VRRIPNLFESLAQDLRYGARTLRRTGRFTAIAIAALAIGIGVNTAVFTVYKAFIVQPLDARDPGSMVNLALRLHSGATSARFSYPDYEAYRDRTESFSGVIAFSIDELKLSGVAQHEGQDGQPGSLLGTLGLLRAASNAELASTFIVSPNYFSVLGVAPVRGRTFEAVSDSELAASPSVLISENYWQRRFGGDPLVLGRSIRLNGAAFAIIGVTPRNFVGTSVAVPNFWLPFELYPLVRPQSHMLRDRDALCCRVFARLAPGVTMREAEAETSVVASRLRILHDPRSDLGEDVTALITPGSPLPGAMAPGLRLTIALIMLAAAMVLVIACANVASLQLARAATRHQELGMRHALGASRGRLIRQLLTESALMGVAAGCIALPVTWALMRAAIAKAAEMLPVEWVLDASPDLGIFVYVLGISLTAAVLFGLTPAIATSRAGLYSILRNSGSSPTRSRLRSLLIAAQVAVSLTLMIAGSLLLRSANLALTMKTGYEDGRVIDLSLQFPEGPKYTAEHKEAIVRDIRSRIAALPGVAATTSARAPNDHGGRRAAVSLTGEHPSDRSQRAIVAYTWVQANYFQTLGIPLTSGRGFDAPAEQAVVLSESAARRLWPGQDAIGRTLRLGTGGQFREPGELAPDGPTWQVVGIARDTRGVALDGSDSEQVYLPLPPDRLHDYPILVRVVSDPTPVMRAVGIAAASVDLDLVASTATLRQMLRQTDAFLAASLSAAIASGIGLLGLVLASVGIYGTVSYVVSLRTREVGIRMAIGAANRDIFSLILRENARPVLGGMAAGVALATGAAHLLRGVLYGLTALDPVSFLVPSILFLTIASAATWLPSRHAMRIDPQAALRHQ